jgi:hypothetical protein
MIEVKLSDTFRPMIFRPTEEIPLRVISSIL